MSPHNDEQLENFWPSFTDLSSTIALILFALVLLAYVQNLISAKSLSGAQDKLKWTLEQLEISQVKLRKTQADIELGHAQLKVAQERVDQQEAVIAQSNRELVTLRTKLYDVALLRVDVLKRVQATLAAELSSASGASAPILSIGDNGNIVIGERLLFEYDSHAVKKEGKSLLDILARAFLNVLSNAEIRDNIDVILIQGHTDERGSVSYNRELSAKRANNVLDYLFASDPTLADFYGSYFASSAYSESRPVTSAMTESAYEQNRRIEISVVAKDTSMRSAIDEYMKNLTPSAAPQGGISP